MPTVTITYCKENGQGYTLPDESDQQWLEEFYNSVDVVREAIDFKKGDALGVISSKEELDFVASVLLAYAKDMEEKELFDAAKAAKNIAHSLYLILELECGEGERQLWEKIDRARSTIQRRAPVIGKAPFEGTKTQDGAKQRAGEGGRWRQRERLKPEKPIPAFPAKKDTIQRKPTTGRGLHPSSPRLLATGAFSIRNNP